MARWTSSKLAQGWQGGKRRPTKAAPSPLGEIRRLHAQVLVAARTTLAKAIRIGELLTKQKASLKHGEWLAWVETNLPFTQASASNYMRCYQRQEELKSKKRF